MHSGVSFFGLLTTVGTGLSAHGLHRIGLEQGEQLGRRGAVLAEPHRVGVHWQDHRHAIVERAHETANGRLASMVDRQAATSSSQKRYGPSRRSYASLLLDGRPYGPACYSGLGRPPPLPSATRRRDRKLS